jgi:hypothetical protein
MVMRIIAGAIVILAGSLLWGAGALATSWAYAGRGNVGSAEMATYGGMAIVVVGSIAFLLAHGTLNQQK